MKSILISTKFTWQSQINSWETMIDLKKSYFYLFLKWVKIIVFLFKIFHFLLELSNFNPKKSKDNRIAIKLIGFSKLATIHMLIRRLKQE